MGRRAAEARRGRSRSESEKNQGQEFVATERPATANGGEEEEEESSGGGGFFACYLLCSLSPRYKGRTYIGFTVNPRRRIRQHNGEIRCGAWRTKRGRPWEMVFCIYGFPSNVSALQFEWAWQHPRESLAVRKAASNLKSLSGVANKIKIAYTMLNLPSWESLNLRVNFFSTKYMKHLGGCPRLPNQMKVTVCIMDDLPCYVGNHTGDNSNCDLDEIVYEEEIHNEEVNSPTKSDTLLSGNTEDPCQFETSSISDSSCVGSKNFIQEFHCFAESPSPGRGYTSGVQDSSLCHEESLRQRSLRHSFSMKLTDSLPLSPEDQYKTRIRKEEHSEAEQPPPLKLSNDEMHHDGLLLSPVYKKYSFFSEDLSCKWLEAGGMDELRRPSPQRFSSNATHTTDNILSSAEDNIIDLTTPSSCILGKHKKRARIYSEIVDLTNSPITIQL